MAQTDGSEGPQSDPPGFRVAVVAHVAREELRDRAARALAGLAEALGAACGSKHEFTAVAAVTNEDAEARLVEQLNDGVRTAAILVSDQLSNEPVSGLLNDRPKTTAWALRVLERFPDRLLGLVAVTHWARRVPDIDRTVGWELNRPSLMDALLKTVRTLEYKAPPARSSLRGPVIVRDVRNESEMEDYFRLRHQVYSVMGYLSNDLEAAPSGLEIDWCDRNSIPIGAFRAEEGEGGMLGTTRVILVQPANPRYAEWARRLCAGDSVVRARFEKGLTLQLPIMQSQDLDGAIVEIYRKGLRCCELSRVIVADECRGTGLSGVLVRYALAVVRRLGLDRVYLECIPGHEALYAKFGFQRLPIGRKRVVDVNKTMIAMELELSRSLAGGAAPEDWFGRSYDCCCRERACYTGRYDLYGTARCPLVASQFFHTHIGRNINLGRLET